MRIRRTILLPLYLCLALSSSAEEGTASKGQVSSAPAFHSVSWEDDLRHPVSWVGLGFDLRLRDEWVNNAATLRSGLPNSETHYNRIRPRIWASLNPTDDIQFSLRLIAEPRYYYRPAAMDGWAFEEGLFDQFNVRLTNIFDQHLSFTIGRQEIIMGSKWLIWDASTTDGTRSEFFDAARVTYSVPESHTRFDGIYVFQYSDLSYWLPAIHDTDRGIIEQDEHAGIFYVSNTSIPDTVMDGYLIFRDQIKVLARGNEGQTWVAGARIEHQFGTRWQARVEGAYDWGDLNDRPLDAWGLNTLLTFKAGGDWKQRFRVAYEYLSGDDPGTHENEGWEPMWARRAQWSELMVQLFGAEHRGRVGDYKNLQKLGAGWTVTPRKWLELNADYAAVFANENPSAGRPGYSDDGNFRGHYVQSITRFTWNKHFSSHIWVEFFMPGNYYSADRQDLATFLRAELMCKF